ncbi:NUMOD3 domain-containing DNA-binding protein [Agrobacterium salinitolerans]|uniref:NUMOD3 domain-containing DNA-binding protein n=1 Tax=Agrobacterium salinitolerans TaxID=1183413 RepID=UPI0022B8534A|nr:NUMOD3 domain-containing DNA-binding protein [Agrobacterium salinitolerans]MCZ7855035.1 NUMOD3 domain-containing DNA-binding protein [Agrobacterium salinitolerans]
MGEYIAANDNDEFRFYVYAWQYPDGRTFYVGKGQAGRDASEKDRNRIFHRIVTKIRREGGEPRIVRWHDRLREEDALHLEMAYIKLFGRRDKATGVLCNLTDGGEGQSGLIHTEEARRKMSAAHTTPEAIAKQRALKTGNRYCVGRKMSAETRAMIGDANRGRSVSEETRAKLSAANLNRGPELVEMLRKLSRNQSQETRDKIADAHRGKIVTAETRAKMSAVQRMAKPREGFKGVSIDREYSKWVASIKIDGKQRKLGRFTDPVDAAKAYDAVAYATYGEDCYLNFGPPAANDNRQLSLPLTS